MTQPDSIFLAIFLIAASFYFANGDYNEQCPVPDLAQLCEADCTDSARNCIIHCGDDQETFYNNNLNIKIIINNNLLLLLL